MNWRERNMQAWRMLSQAQRKLAVSLLRYKLPADIVPKIKARADSDPDWLAEYHFGWGMSIRNLLRSVIKDNELPPSVWDVNKGDHNWDDYYGAVVEVAVRGGIYWTLTSGELE